jgi:pimeloyl-ACP methyl ester carboxylesterase
MRAAQHVFVLLLAVASMSVRGAPQVAEPEQVIADRLAERAVRGEFVWLEAGTSRFLALYLAPPGSDRARAVLLLHGLGAHPDWPDVIHPLRERLPDLGWATLAIQLPRLSPQASHADELQLPRRAAPRLQAALRYLAGRGITTIAVVGHGLGAALGAQNLAAPGKGVTAFASISLQVSGHLVEAVDYPGSLEAVRVPVLDVQAERDDPVVLQQAPERELWGRKNKTRTFDRIVIPNAEGGYHGREEELARALAGWLEVNARP